MKLRAGTLVLALLVMTIPVQGQAAPTPILEDTLGDVQADLGGNAAPDQADSSQLDLLSLDAIETAENIQFVLEIADTEGAGKQDRTFTRYEVTFRAQDLDYMVRINRFADNDPSATLHRFGQGEGEWFLQERLYPVLDAAASTYTVDVPRDELLDAMGSAPQPGWKLSEFRAESNSISIKGCCNMGPAGEVPIPDFKFGDAMPDTGFGSKTLDIQLGIRQTGHALLASKIPFRASNGEATTFVFDIVGWNTGDATDTFEIETVGTVSGWEITVPQPVVEIEPRQNTSIPIVITTPFAHKHGALESIVVEMTSLSDRDAVGRIEVGIRYNEIPQPAGHHPTLWFHGAKDEVNEFETVFMNLFAQDWSVDSYMNAAEMDDTATGDPIPAFRWGVDPITEAGPQQHYRWLLPLKPGLQMGLDFDLTRDGVLTFPVETDVPMLGATLHAELIHIAALPPDANRFDRDEGTRTVIATANTEPVDVQSGTHVFSAPIKANADGDFILYEENAGLTFEVTLSFTRLDPFLGPSLAPRLKGGQADLPLHEYRDPVDDIYSSVEGLVIHAESEQERLVNPGETVLFRLTLMDHGQGQGTFDIELSGNNHKWATIVGDERIRVGLAESKPVVIAVTAPTDARDGDVSDLLVQVINADDPSVRSMARVLAEVDTDIDHDNEEGTMLELQGVLTSDKESPGITLVVLLAGLALFALRRRL